MLQVRISMSLCFINGVGYSGPDTMALPPLFYVYCRPSSDSRTAHHGRKGLQFLDQA